MVEKIIKIGISGASGRVGKEILHAVSKDGSFDIKALLEKKGHSDIGSCINGIEVSDDLEVKITEIDVLIDFTGPKSSLGNLEICYKHKVPLIIGTTGLSEEFYEKAKEFSKEFPILISSNMSIGVNVLFELVSFAAKVLQDYDTEIIETHHRFKKDAPSGTALTLARQILDAQDRLDEFDTKVKCSRSGFSQGREKGEIGIHAVRAGDIIGEHDVYFASNSETIRISHSAGNRQIFALGALKAARFLINKQPGFYTMRDVLGL